MKAAHTVAVVDYGMGNLRSVAQALAAAGGPQWHITVTAHPQEVLAAARVVLPGQGAMPECLRQLRAAGLHAAVLHAAAHKPLLGICVGMQMLLESSAEGDVACLAHMPGRVEKLSAAPPLKLPHMGWNRVHPTQPHALWQGIGEGEFFYFVHSYCARPAKAGHVAAETDYGGRFACAVAAGNVFATQFHPEKSAAQGLQLLRNFLHWQPA